MASKIDVFSFTKRETHSFRSIRKYISLATLFQLALLQLISNLLSSAIAEIFPCSGSKMSHPISVSPINVDKRMANSWVNNTPWLTNEFRQSMLAIGLPGRSFVAALLELPPNKKFKEILRDTALQVFALTFVEEEECVEDLSKAFMKPPFKKEDGIELFMHGLVKSFRDMSRVEFQMELFKLYKYTDDYNFKMEWHFKLVDEYFHALIAQSGLKFRRMHIEENLNCNGAATLTYADGRSCWRDVYENVSICEHISRISVRK